MCVFFFFKQKTAYEMRISDWSSDVCSSDLRDGMLLATKGGIIPGVPYDSSAPYLASAIDASLRRLRTERVELWQIHRPDLLAHPQEIARTLEEAHGAGKIGAIGVSNFTPAQTSALAHFLPVPLVSHQIGRAHV